MSVESKITIDSRFIELDFRFRADEKKMLSEDIRDC